MASAVCSVYDQLGRVVLRRELAFEDGSATLDTGALEEGMYYLELKNETEGSARKRIFIMR